MAFYVGNHKNNPTKYSECGCHKQVFVSFTELQKDPIAAFQKILEIFIPGTVCQNRIDLSA